MHMCAKSFVFVSDEMCFDAKQKSFESTHRENERERASVFFPLVTSWWIMQKERKRWRLKQARPREGQAHWELTCTICLHLLCVLKTSFCSLATAILKVCCTKRNHRRTDYCVYVRGKYWGHCMDWALQCSTLLEIITLIIKFRIFHFLNDGFW